MEHFGESILRKIIKTVAVRYILRLKCIKFDFGEGSTPEPPRAYSTPSDSLAGFQEAYFYKRREGKGREKGRKRRGRESARDKGKGRRMKEEFPTVTRDLSIVETPVSMGDCKEFSKRTQNRSNIVMVK